MPLRDAEERRKYNARYYEGRKHVIAPRMLSRARQNRQDGLAKMGGRCVKCGSQDKLQLDHIDCRTKVSHNIWTWGVAAREAEMAKCQLLCEPCHIEKSKLAGEWHWRTG